ncbi:MAG: 5,10-methylene-tetrahydrofolate dehydrogenase/methenyl tetrahydrofolate cyclohydrolase [Clostridia bacterium]|jgi:methylenetetrahydrofolate dehydrogenase (NADP+)/methenyltetrahydrofolate cyclohydrolase|nr:5,10-methylene-tetrahydrofolate dehydrogenase/methenyl tetrahydrofolate cyclohydrolase [Clostridia bacterium]
MDKILSGKEVSLYLMNRLKKRMLKLKCEGVVPAAAFIRVGSNRDDIAYQNSILKTCNSVGVTTVLHELEEETTTEALIKLITSLNEKNDIHGIMIFRPLPEAIDEELINSVISPYKDVEGMNPINLAKVFAGNYGGFAPCTAAAVMEILKYYNISLKGKHAVILGRSMVVGKPLSMMLLKEDETVTLCHSKTENIKEIARTGDVLVAAMGRLNAVGADYIKPGAIVIDVGINVDKDGKIHGDVNFEEAEKIASLITPVPGGVGSVTTAILIKNIVKAAKNSKVVREVGKVTKLV